MEYLAFELSRLEYACLVLIWLQLQDKDKKWVIENFLTFIQLCNLISKKEGKYQESIWSSTKPDPWNYMGMIIKKSLKYV